MKDPFDQDLSETELVKLALLYAIHGFFDDALNLLSRQRLLIEKELEEALSWLKREPFSASLSKNWTRRKFDRIVYALRSDPWEENFKGWRRGDSSLPQWPY